MPTGPVKLPTGEVVTLFAATGKHSDAANYFNGKRISTELVEATTAQYRSRIWLLQAQLNAEIEASAVHFDALVCAPSSQNDARVYADSILQRWSIRDLSGTFTRRHIMKASDPGVTVDMLATQELILNPGGSEAGIKSLLIVDDAFATGKTVAAMLQLLRRAGLSPDASVSVAVCADMNT